MKTPVHDHKAGFTLIESLFALSFLVILFLAVVHASLRASDAFDQGSLEHELSTHTHRALERIAGELELAERATLTPDPLLPLGQSGLTFRSPTGFAGGAVQWGPNTTIQFEEEPGEPDDGIDNDGDGFVDEGRVLWIQAPGTAEERRVVLCSNVADRLEGELENGLDDNGNGLLDERGLAFVAENDVLSVLLTCERRDDQGRTLRKSGQTAVKLRN
jgi:hypothetical protein